MHLEHLLQLHELNLFCTDYRIQLELWCHSETITLFMRRQRRKTEKPCHSLSCSLQVHCSLSCVKLSVDLLVIMIVHNGLRLIYCTRCYFPTASHVSAARGHCHMPTVSHFREGKKQGTRVTRAEHDQRGRPGNDIVTLQ